MQSFLRASSRRVSSFSSKSCLPRLTPCLRSTALPTRGITTTPFRRLATSNGAQQTRIPRDPYAARKKHNMTIGLYVAAFCVFGVGATYAAVPLYRAFCAATGFSGIPLTDQGSSRFAAERLTPVREAKRIKVHFNADTSSALQWSFTPQQKFVSVLPGETALAFYTAKNNMPYDVIGIATYNVTPQKIAPYFAKVECFCFEEQKLRVGEEVDLPLFFFIDKDFVDDPWMADIDDVVLSYTFFKARRDDETGHLVPDAPEDVVDKAMGFEDYVKAPKPQPASSSTSAAAPTPVTAS